MTVRIAPDTQARILRSLGRVAIQVQETSDPEGAALALERARPDIGLFALRGTREVERIPSGPFVMVVDRDDGQRRLLEVPEVVAHHLEAAGIDGTVACIDHGGFLTSSLWGLATLGPAVICRLYPPPPEIEEDPPTGLPGRWMAEAAAWLLEDLAADHALWAEVGLVDLSMPAEDATAFLEQQRLHRRSPLVVAADPRPDDSANSHGLCGDGARSGCDDRPVRAVALCSSPLTTHLALGAGGPGAVGDLLSLVEEFTVLTRRLAHDVAYGFVDVSPTFLRFAGASHPLELFCDEAVFDAYPYQVLGPGHLARLGGPPPEARPIAPGRVELAAPDLPAWVANGAGVRSVGPGNRVLRGAMRTALAPCIDLDGHRLRHERWDRVKRRRLDLEDLAVPEYRFDPPDR